MKKFFLPAIIAGLFITVKAGTGNEDLPTTTEAPKEVAALPMKIELSSQDAMNALARISVMLENYPENYMLVFQQAQLDVMTQKYSLVYDIQDGNGEVVLSRAEPLYMNFEDGSLYLASGQ